MKAFFLKSVLLFNLLIDLLMIGFCVTIGNYGFTIGLIIAIMLSVIAIRFLNRVRGFVLKRNNKKRGSSAGG